MFASRFGKGRASLDVNSFPSNTNASDWLPPNLLLIRTQNAPPNSHQVISISLQCILQSKYSVNRNDAMSCCIMHSPYLGGRFCSVLLSVAGWFPLLHLVEELRRK